MQRLELQLAVKSPKWPKKQKSSFSGLHKFSSSYRALLIEDCKILNSFEENFRKFQEN